MPVSTSGLTRVYCLSTASRRKWYFCLNMLLMRPWTTCTLRIFFLGGRRGGVLFHCIKQCLDFSSKISYSASAHLSLSLCSCHTSEIFKSLPLLRSLRAPENRTFANDQCKAKNPEIPALIGPLPASVNKLLHSRKTFVCMHFRLLFNTELFICQLCSCFLIMCLWHFPFIPLCLPFRCHKHVVFSSTAGFSSKGIGIYIASVFLNSGLF